MSDKNIDKSIEIVRKFNKQNRYRDGGVINNAIENVLSELEEGNKIRADLYLDNVSKKFEIENLKQELEKKKEHNLTLMKEIGKRDKKIEEKDEIITKASKELEIKDKMIDLMAEYIEDKMLIKISTKEDIIEHFRNEVLKDE